jgi:flagellar motor switch/type III secretory pathway protein FliN
LEEIPEVEIPEVQESNLPGRQTRYWVECYFPQSVQRTFAERPTGTDRDGLTLSQANLIDQIMQIPVVVSLELAVDSITVRIRRGEAADPGRVRRLMQSLALESRVYADSA